MNHPSSRTPARHRALVAAMIGLSFPAVAHAVQFPVELTTWNAAQVATSVNVTLPSTAVNATQLYARIHNLRFGGQISIRLNNGPWVHVYNHTVEVFEPDRSQGGIGGINRTVAFAIPLGAGAAAPGLSHNITIRINGTDGIVSAIRVIDLDFLNAAGQRLIPAAQRTQENPNLWLPPSTVPADITAGANLWRTANLVENPISRAAIRGKCASCHFADGSDLKYFNFSNDAIIARARYHGLTALQGQQIASYIRSSTKIKPGRPWNPPFQPGPGLDPLPAESAAIKANKARAWMAGAGLDAVAGSQAEILSHVFPAGTSTQNIAKIIDHTGNFSVREIPISIPFPDWNAWLPEYALEDMWPNSSQYNVPLAAYGRFRAIFQEQSVTALTNQGKLTEAFDTFWSDLIDWYGDFRLADQDFANESAISKARTPSRSREEVVRSLVHWMAMKMMEVVRDYNLEDKHDAIAVIRANGHPAYTPDVLMIPGSVRLATVFAHAPHITSNNWAHFENQPEWLGKMESNQWYHLQLCLNPGSRMVLNMNQPVDWDYQLIHTEEASERSGLWNGFQRLITHIKMYQSRDNGAGVRISGFSQRTLAPWQFYSDRSRNRSLFKGALDAVEPGLWRKTYEELLHEWLDVMESMNLNDPALVPRSFDRHELEPASYTPQAWSGSGHYFVHPNEVYADLLFRLLPLLPADNIDPMLLVDLREWCKRAWPLGAWNSRFVTNTLYSENFEDGESGFDVLNSALTVSTIKSANYVNNYSIGIRNGGGAKVGTRGLTADAVRTGIHDGLNISVAGMTRLRLRARVAFKDDDGIDAGNVRFSMQVRFNHSGTIFGAEDVMEMDPALFQKKFVSYESFLNVPSGATSINWLIVRWERIGGVGGGTVYLDNVSLESVNTTPDTVRPAAPDLTAVVRHWDTALEVRWTPTSPNANSVVGYHIYRAVDGVANAPRIRISHTPIENPNNDFRDFTIRPGTRYRYFVTAVDGAGNESDFSDSLANDIPDDTAPLPPGGLAAVQVNGTITLRWLASHHWDVKGYRIFRKASTAATYSLIADFSAEPGALYFVDTTATELTTYQYYMRAVDLVGNLSAASPNVSITSAATASIIDQWKADFEGLNGWDTGNSLTSSDTADFDGDGVSTLWEYVLGTNPAIPEGTTKAGLTVSRKTVSGQAYSELTYTRRDPLPPGVQVQVQFSDDLLAWSTRHIVEGGPVASGIVVTVGPTVAGNCRVSVRQTNPISAGASRFMRLFAQESPL